MTDAVWTAELEWPGEPVFIIGGGPSVAGQDLNLLRGRRVIAINSSYTRYTEPDIIFFGDYPWWLEHGRRLRNFKGRIVTPNRRVWKERQLIRRRFAEPDFLYIRRVVPNTDPKKREIGPGFSHERDAVVSNKTSFQGAMNLAVHLAGPPGPLVLLGMDMRRAEDGIRTHHHAPHHWRDPPTDAAWDNQMVQLALIVEPLRQLGVRVINTSPVSRIPDEWGWERLTLEQSIQSIEMRMAS